MIILDLACDLQPKWKSTRSFYGKPFIWCLIHNLGGARGIYGNLSGIANQPVDARNAPGSSMVGIGMTAEAIEHNPVVYDLMVSCLVPMNRAYIVLALSPGSTASTPRKEGRAWEIKSHAMRSPCRHCIDVYMCHSIGCIDARKLHATKPGDKLLSIS